MAGDPEADRPGDELDALVRSVWPTGAPDEWEPSTAWLSVVQRITAARRLGAMVRLVDREGADRIDVGTAAELTGLGVPRIYQMAAAWRRKRSARSLGVYAADEPHRPSRIDPEVRRKAAGIVTDLLRESPESRIVDVERVLIASGMKLSSTTVRRLIAECRRKMAPGVFGARIVVESAGMDAMLDGERMRLFAVLDAGTGLLLGWVNGTERSRALALTFAADDAIARLAVMDLEGFVMAEDEPRLDLRLQDEDAEGRRILGDLLGEAGVSFELDPSPPGAAIVEALGERVGHVWLGVGGRADGRSYRYGLTRRMPEYSGALDQAINDAIETHNNDRRRRAGATWSEKGRVAEMKANVRELLSNIAAAEDALLRSPYYADVFARVTAAED